MKKLLLSIFLSIFLSSPSFAKQIICTTTNYFGDPVLMDFKNPKPFGEIKLDEWLLDGKQPFWETTFESESVMVLQSFSRNSGILSTIHIAKKSNKLVYTTIWGIYERDTSVSYGQCKFID
jgi:hypothetical protein